MHVLFASLCRQMKWQFSQKCMLNVDLVVALPLLTQVCCNLCLLYFIKDCHLENHLTASSGVQGLNEIFVAIKNDGVAATKEKIHQWFSVFPTLPNHNLYP